MTKISIRSNEFTQPIAEALDQSKALVIWHQIPWSGGGQEWFIIRRLEELKAVLNRGITASAFTAYEWIEVFAGRIVDQDWPVQISEALAKETHNQMLLILPAMSETNEPIRLTFVEAAEDIQEYYEQHLGSDSTIGRIPSVWTGEIVRGYYPDENGIPQSGPY